MGYRSEVGFKVQFKDATDKQKFITTLGADWETVKGLVTGGATTIAFAESWIKWYTTRTIGSMAEGYEDVDALDRLVALAQELNELPDDGEKFIRSSGYFGRVGEERNDIEEWAWDGNGDGLPYGHDLGSIITSITIEDDDE